MRDPQSRPTIIDEDGARVTGGPDSARGSQACGPFDSGFPAGLPPIPEHVLNKHGKPSLLKMIGWKGAVVLALVVAGVIALAVASFMVLLFVLPIVLLVAVIGWLARKVRGPREPLAGASRVIVVRRSRL